MTPQERAIAQAQVAGFATGYRALADVLQLMDRRFLAQAMRRVAASLGTGTPYRLGEGEIDMETIRSVGDAIAHAERTIEALRLEAEELGPEARPGFEIRAAPVIRDLSKMVPDPELWARFGRELSRALSARGGRGAARGGLRRGSDPRSSGSRSARRRWARRGGARRRIAAGGTTNYGLAQDWVARDMDAVLVRDGLTLARASEAQQAAALETVDRIMEGSSSARGRWALPGRTSRVGCRADVAPGRSPALPEGRGAVSGRARESQRAAGAGGPAPRRSARCARGGEDRAGAAEQLVRTLSGDGLAALRAGRHEILAEALPDPLDRIAVTKSVLELSHAETGEAIFAERASALQQDRAEALARQSRLEMPAAASSPAMRATRSASDDAPKLGARAHGDDGAALGPLDEARFAALGAYCCVGQ